MSKWKEFREELMQDPDVKAAYDAHAPEREKRMNYTKGGFPVWDDDFDREHFTQEEIEESNMRVELITALVQTSLPEKDDAR